MISNKYNQATALVILVTFILLLAACGGAEERKSVYFNQGKDLFAQGNYEKARLDFQNTLQIDPNHVEARFMLAQTLEELDESKSAAGHYKRAVELNPNHVKAKSRLARIYILGGVIDKAKELANEVIIANPQDSTALTVLATITSLDGDREQAIVQARKSLEVDPKNNDTIALLASLYVKQERYDDAIKILSNTIAETNDASFKIILAGIYVSQEKLDDAINILKNVLADDPKNLANVARLASLYSRVERDKEAEELLRKTIEIAVDDHEAKMLLINYLSANKDLESAESELKTFIKADPKNYELQFGLATLYNQSARYDEEVEVYNSIIADDVEGPSALKAKNALALRYLVENKVDEAKKLIGEVLAKNATDNDSLMLHGTLAFGEKRYDDAISDFRSVLRDQPRFLRARKLLAKAHINKKEYGLAKDNLQMALDVNKNDLEAKLDLAMVLQNLNSKDDAMEQVQQILAIAPNHIGALEMLFKHQFAQNEVKASKDTAEKIKSNYPEVALGYYLSGLVHARNRENNDGIKQFKLALEKQPMAIEPLNGLVRLLLQEKKHDQALAELDKILDEHPDYLIAKNMKGEVLLLVGKNDAAEKEFKSVIDNNQKLVTPYTNLASLEIKQNNFDEAIKIYQKGIDNGADKTSLRLQMANVYQQTSDNDKAIQVYEEILKDKPDMDLAANNLAMLLVSYKHEDQQSVKRAMELVTQLKDSKNPAYLDTIGWTYYRAGEYTTALPYMDKALAMAPEEPLLLYHTGMTLFDAGEVEKAREKLEKSVQSKQAFLGRDEAEQTLQKIANAQASAMN